MGKRAAALLMALMMAFSLTACGKGESAPAGTAAAGKPENEAQGDASTILKLGHGQTEVHPYHLGAERFASLVKEKTEGRVEIQIYPNGALGQERDMVEGLTLGTVDMCITTNAPLTNFASRFGVFEFPYLFKDYEHAHKVLDGETGQDIMKDLEPLNIVGLAYFENGFRNITNSKHTINTVSDLAGLKIRVMESPVHIASFQAMGANPTPMAWSEVYTAIQQGTIDGQENPTMAIVDGKIYEVNKYMSVTEHFYSPAELLISKAVFDKLSAEDQKALREAADEAKVYQRDEAYQINNTDKLSVLEENGVEITRVDKSSFEEAVKSVYEKNEKEYGELIRKVQAEAE